MCRFGYKLPRYNQIINALTWMSHAVALRRMAQDYVIDLYLRPPVWHFRLMDYHLMDRIVKSSNQCAPMPYPAPCLEPGYISARAFMFACDARQRLKLPP